MYSGGERIPRRRALVRRGGKGTKSPEEEERSELESCRLCIWLCCCYWLYNFSSDPIKNRNKRKRVRKRESFSSSISFGAFGVDDVFLFTPRQLYSSSPFIRKNWLGTWGAAQRSARLLFQRRCRQIVWTRRVAGSISSCCARTYSPTPLSVKTRTSSRLLFPFLHPMGRLGDCNTSLRFLPVSITCPASRHPSPFSHQPQSLFVNIQKGKREKKRA